jgi:hypothetical protein
VQSLAQPCLVDGFQKVLYEDHQCDAKSFANTHTILMVFTENFKTKRVFIKVLQLNPFERHYFYGAKGKYDKSNLFGRCNSAETKLVQRVLH